MAFSHGKFYGDKMIDENLFEGLTPEERIKKLKSLEDEKKKELAQMEQLILSSEEEIKRRDIVQRMRAPEPRRVNVDELFSSGLEEKVEKEKPETGGEGGEDNLYSSEKAVSYEANNEPSLMYASEEFYGKRTGLNSEEGLEFYASPSRGIAKLDVPSINTLAEIKKYERGNTG